MKAKLTCTMYYDYDSETWDWDKPQFPAKLNKDYSLMRKGSIFSVYFTPEEVEQFQSNWGYNLPYEEGDVIFAHKNSWWILYHGWNEVIKRGIWKFFDGKTKQQIFVL